MFMIFKGTRDDKGVGYIGLDKPSRRVKVVTKVVELNSGVVDSGPDKL